MNKWYRLDNAAKIFPSVTSVKNSSVFRVSAVLTEVVNKEILQKATDTIFDRFPMFFVRLRKGLFWNYLDENTRKFLIEPEKDYPCCDFNPRTNNGYLLRVLYYNNRVSAEFFHSLTDGNGAVEFLKSLLYYYLQFSGYNIKSEGKIILADECVQACDFEDSFENYYKEVKEKSANKEKSYLIKGTPFEDYGCNVIHGVIDASKLNAIAKENGATITSYIASIITYSIYQTRMKYGIYNEPVTVTIPVGLRKIFPSKTLRNFFGVVNVETKITRETSFDEIVVNVTKKLKESIQKENMQKILSSNVRLEKNQAAKFVPLFIKKPLLNMGYNKLSEDKKTITLSNLGKILLPCDMTTHIKLMEAVLYPTPKTPINCGICSVNNDLVISFTRTIEETDILRFFFSYLAEKTGLDLLIYSNDWGINNDKV